MMNQVLMTVTHLALLAPAVVAGGGTPTCVIGWDVETGLVPDQASPVWVLSDNAPLDPILENGALRIETSSVSHTMIYTQREPLLGVPPLWIIEFELQVVSGFSNHSSRLPNCFCFDVVPGTGNMLFIGVDELMLNTDASGSSCSQRGPSVVVATTDDFHEYRIEIDTIGGGIDVFQDDQRVLQGALFTAGTQCFFGSPRLFWGEGSASTYGTSLWKSVSHNAGTTGSLETYGTGKLNSLGCSPAIGAIGTPSASGSAFHITASQVLNNKFGILFFGFGANDAPFQGGSLLVAPPLSRTPPQLSGGSATGEDCSGAYDFDFGALIQSGAVPGLGAGASVYSQYWSRDPQDAFGTGLTDGLHFTICP